MPRDTDPVFEPELRNDAEILGQEPEGLADFLARDATFLVGEMWGAKDRRNTQDGDWKSVTMPLLAWIDGQAGSKNKTTWGLSHHPEGKNKAGSSIVLGSSIGGARKAKAMDTMYAMGLDIDSGTSFGDVTDKLEELGILTIAYTTFNNGKSGNELKRDEVLRKLGLSRDPTLDEVQRFLREHDKNRYEESFIAECSIKAQKHQTSDGVKIVLDTPPLEKFRLVFPLATPIKIIDLAETHEAALAIWEDKVTGLARNLLGVHFDTSCTDPSRLFFTPRHPKGGEYWDSVIVQGSPLSFDDIQPMKKSVYARDRDGNAFTMAGADENRVPQCRNPSGASLNEWHRDAKDRFMMADLLETLCPDKIRVAGGEAQGHVHVECPFEHEHTTEGGTATMAINAIDSQNGYWTWFCHHDACQGRHKLEFLEEALRQGWFDEAALADPEAGFLLDVADGENDPFAPLDGDLGDENLTPEERAKAFNTDATDDDIRKFIKSLWRDGADMSTQANVTAVIACNTNLGKRDVKKFWKELEDAQKRSEKDVRADRKGVAYTDDPAPALTRYAMDSVRAENDRNPFLFEYMEAPTIVRKGRLKTLKFAGQRHELGKVTTFYKLRGDNDPQHVYPPEEVVNDLFASDTSEFLLPLQGVVNTPFFAADGTLVTENGYHAESEVYLDSDLVLDRVSGEPTEEDAQEAARFIVEECLADFPLGGLTRQEIVDQVFTPSGVPAVANTLAFILLHFARNMISGNTPGHIVNKPAPGTGAGYLVDVCTTIRSGASAPALAMPKNKDELSKTLVAVLMDGEPAIFFDNINHEMDSGELASAMTAPPDRGYMARILGRSQTVSVRIRSSWIFAANTLTMSPELLRRCILIDLDRKATDPGKWTPKDGWRHDDVRAWTRDNRAKLVHACLTIIQRWVHNGMKKSNDTLASFENWAGVMGGILESCGIGGLMGNQSELAELSDGRDDEVTTVIQAIAEVMNNVDGARLYVGTKSDKEVARGRFGLFDILHDMPDTPRLDKWGYRDVFVGDDVDVQYHNTRSAGARFKAAAKRTYRVRLNGMDYDARFECETDTSTNSNCYALLLDAR